MVGMEVLRVEDMGPVLEAETGVYSLEDMCVVVF